MVIPVDLAFVGAKLHGMRSRVYEGPRLDALRSLHNVFDMIAAVSPTLDVTSRMRFEQHLVREHVSALGRIAVYLTGANADFFDWQLERYRLENLKVLLRGWKTRQAPAEVKSRLVELSTDYALPVDKILAAADIGDIARLVPVKPFAREISRRAAQFDDTKKLFAVEAGLDAVHLAELCRRAGSLAAGDRSEVSELLGFEVLMVDVLFAMRARLNYDLAAEEVREFLVTDAPCAPPGHEFAVMLEGKTFAEMLRAAPRAKMLVGPGPDVAGLEEFQQRLWERLYRLANRLFTRSSLHMGVVEAFYYIKRVELNNLIRVAELLRQEVPPAEMARRLIRLA